MQSREYRSIIKAIVKNSIKKKASFVTRKAYEDIADEVARAVHARLYGAAVDGVASPLWRNNEEFVTDFPDAMPTKTAQEILNTP